MSSGLAAFLFFLTDSEPGRTNELYDRYKKFCETVGTEPRSNKRFQDFLNVHERAYRRTVSYTITNVFTHTPHLRNVLT
ncbi:hypothetical protein [Haloarcula quadrata]|uniref:hypothetical protein n=1 Tax=Haloarcula quadrata TaxID=182779 RepID=UPI000EB3CE5E